MTSRAVDDQTRFRKARAAGASAPFRGLIEGAQLLTLRGERTVESLQIGDRLLSRNGAVPLVRIDVVSAVVPAVYVMAGSLGHSRTDRDALLTADQMVHLNDWRAGALRGQPSTLVTACTLVDGEFVRDVGQQLLTLYRLYCATPQILFADGLELCTADVLEGASVCHMR